MNVYVPLSLLLLSLVACGSPTGTSTGSTSENSANPPVSNSPTGGGNGNSGTGSTSGGGSESGIISFTIGGTVNSLWYALSETLVLQNNSADTLNLTSNGAFTFDTALADGSAYAISVLTQPGGQTCTVSNGSGIVSSSNVTSVSVSCATATGVIVTIIGGPSNRGFFPFDLAFDSSGNLYFSDVETDQISKIDLNSGVATIVAGTGPGDYSEDGGITTNAELCDTSSHAFTGQTGPLHFSGDGGPATRAVLCGPVGLTFDSSENLYVATTGQIRKIDKITGVITTIAGNGLWDGKVAGDGGLATSAVLDALDIAFDPSENIYFTDSGNHRIRKIDKISGIITTIAGIGTQGYSGDGGAATDAELYYPSNLVFDSFGDLYFSDSGNNRIRKINMKNGAITTVAGTGTYSYSGDGGLAINAELSDPRGLAFDSSGNLYFGDSYNQRIRKIDMHSGIITTFAGTGDLRYGNGKSDYRVRSGYSGDGGPATSAQLSDPFDLAFDSLGNLFISDTGNQRIRMVGK